VPHQDANADTRPLVPAVRQRLAELHGRAFATSARAILGKGAQATVGAGLATNQAGVGGVERRKGWCRQLPLPLKLSTAPI
jgi:hypothetical protein